MFPIRRLIARLYRITLESSAPGSVALTWMQSSTPNPALAGNHVCGGTGAVEGRNKLGPTTEGRSLCFSVRAAVAHNPRPLFDDSALRVFNKPD